jgi:methionyl-tRNA synthetase
MREKDPDCTKKIDYAHAIMQDFRYRYKDRWVSTKELMQKDRLWQKTFNDLIKQGFIERKKTHQGYSYRWRATLP